MRSLPLLAVLLLSLALSCKPDAPGPQETGADPASSPETSAPRFTHPLEVNYEGTLDMGNLYAREKRHGEFVLKNVSDFPQEIQNIFPTCDCIRMDQSYRDITLEPQGTLTVGFVMDAATVSLSSFGRVIQINSKGNRPLTARVGGHILPPVEITPGKDVELGFLPTPATPVVSKLTLQKHPAMTEELVLGAPQENPYFLTELRPLGEDSYEMTLTSRQNLPYGRGFKSMVRIPILQPESAREILLVVTADVAELVYFAPDTWKIRAEKLQEAGSLTECFVYGEVPGRQEERKIGDPASSNRNLMRMNLLKQKNAIPLKFVKEHQDWDDLFQNLDFQVPPGVKLEKVRHPQGMELQVTVTPESFPEGVTQLSIVPFRSTETCPPIVISLETAP
ncbi:MAG: DUF1573 domain-containing protein [Oligosphaeraceae bacterium]